MVTGRKVVGALALLYMAQGIPFGFATEYLPVVLREQGFSYSQIAAIAWLQLPWQLKVVWAKVADHPRVRPRTRVLVLALQLCLTVAVAGFALRTLKQAPVLWFALTAISAFLAATQDVFVDAFAVRVLRPEDRGFGNTAQVAGYRLGMLVGGAALLLLVGSLGERTTLLWCAGVVALASIGAFVSGDDAPASARSDEAKKAPASPKSIAALVRHMLDAKAWPVLAIALTYKLGLHMAGALLKPMAVDYGWTKHQIGWAMVTVGSAAALAGSAAGGILHRASAGRESRALVIALVAQAFVCAPLVVVDLLHAPIGITTFAIAAEHFGSGLGTTVLFAALMTATRRADAGLHYTILTSANALAIGIGSFAGGLLADHAGKLATFVVASIVCLLPGVLLSRWRVAAEASAD